MPTKKILTEKKTGTQKKVIRKPATKAGLEKGSAVPARKNHAPVSADSDMVLPVLSPDGTKSGNISVPKELFGAPYNAQLVAQAIRIYRMNQREGSGATKTRGMVEGSTKKIYRQKGTGRARHGGIRAPIFVGGGISFGPQPRLIRRSFPKRMKIQALASVLSMKCKDQALTVVGELDHLPVKTKAFAEMLRHINRSGRVLIVHGEATKGIVRAVRNIQGVTVISNRSLTTYSAASHPCIIFAKDAVTDFVKRLKKE